MSVGAASATAAQFKLAQRVLAAMECVAGVDYDSVKLASVDGKLLVLVSFRVPAKP